MATSVRPARPGEMSGLKPRGPGDWGSREADRSETSERLGAKGDPRGDRLGRNEDGPEEVRRLPSSACARHAGARLSSRARRRAAVVVIAAAGCSLAIAPPAGAAQGCAAAAGVPGSAPDVSLRRALRCLVNAERGRRGLRPLRASRRLGAAARSHASRHGQARLLRARARPAGRSPAACAPRAGAAGPRPRRSAGAAAAWACRARCSTPGSRARPTARSCSGVSRRAGIGLALGAPLPLDCSGAGTWVLDVGR